MKQHGIARPDWEAQFRARIQEKAVTPEDEKLHPETVAEITAAELESWTDDRDDWTYTTPEEAADEQMSNWEPD